ncbi:hypothetical protein PFISCL1PPCAC_22412, partial [Pristionchus fissidentatus]
VCGLLHSIVHVETVYMPTRYRYTVGQKCPEIARLLHRPRHHDVPRLPTRCCKIHDLQSKTEYTSVRTSGDHIQ